MHMGFWHADRFVVVTHALEERRTPGNTLIVQPDQPWQVCSRPHNTPSENNCCMMSKGFLKMEDLKSLSEGFSCGESITLQTLQQVATMGCRSCAKPVHAASCSSHLCIYRAILLFCLAPVCACILRYSGLYLDAAWLMLALCMLHICLQVSATVSMRFVVMSVLPLGMSCRRQKQLRDVSLVYTNKAWEKGLAYRGHS